VNSAPQWLRRARISCDEKIRLAPPANFSSSIAQK